PLIVVALRLTAVSRDTWAVAGRPGATGPRLTVTGAPAWEAATAPLVSGRWALTGADPPATGPATGGATSIPAASTPAGTMASGVSSEREIGGGGGGGSSAGTRTG